MDYHPLLDTCLAMFWCMGVHPGKGYDVKQILLFFIIFISQWIIIYLGMLHLIYEDADITISELTNTLETLFLSFHAMIKLTFAFAKKRGVHDLLERTKLFWKIENIEDEVQKKEHLEYQSSVKMLFRMYNILCITTSLAFMCRPLLLGGGHLTFTTYKPHWIPFYVMIIFENTLFAVGIYGAVSGVDLFVLTLLLLLKMQFKLLNQEIVRVFEETCRSKNTLKNFNAKIKKIVNYHNFLLNYVNRINDVISEGILAYMMVIVLSMCVEMYIVSTQKSLTASIKAVIYLTNGIVQFMICYCLPAQTVTNEAERVSDYVYFGEWYESPVSSVKVAQIMMIGRAQQKTLILGGRFVKIDLETYLATIKTMVSYAMFIRTMGIGKN